jgi:hypothetical protein
MNIKKFFITFGLVTVLLAGTFASVSAASPVHVTTFKAVYSAGSIRTRVGVADALNKPLSGAKVQISYEKEGVPIRLLNACSGNRPLLRHSDQRQMAGVRGRNQQTRLQLQPRQATLHHNRRTVTQ